MRGSDENTGREEEALWSASGCACVVYVAFASCQSLSEVSQCVFIKESICLLQSRTHERKYIWLFLYSCKTYWDWNTHHNTFYETTAYIRLPAVALYHIMYYAYSLTHRNVSYIHRVKSNKQQQHTVHKTLLSWSQRSISSLHTKCIKMCVSEHFFFAKIIHPGDRCGVSRCWLNGTTITINGCSEMCSFILKKKKKTLR